MQCSARPWCGHVILCSTAALQSLVTGGALQAQATGRKVSEIQGLKIHPVCLNVRIDLLVQVDKIYVIYLDHLILHYSSWLPARTVMARLAAGWRPRSCPRPSLGWWRGCGGTETATAWSSSAPAGSPAHTGGVRVCGQCGGREILMYSSLGCQTSLVER